MIKYSKKFGTTEEINKICKNHINHILIDFLKSIFDDKDFYTEEYGTFNKYLKNYFPKFDKSRNRENKIKKIIDLLEKESECQLSLEQEYIIFKIIDDYVNTYDLEDVSYALDLEEDKRFPKFWIIENTIDREKVINNFKEHAEIIFKECSDCTKEEILLYLMSQIEDISIYAENLDDNDYLLLDIINYN